MLPKEVKIVIDNDCMVNCCLKKDVVDGGKKIRTRLRQFCCCCFSKNNEEQKNPSLSTRT